MSSFTGKFKEYPMISADNFEKENLSSLAFFLSHCHKDHMSGLDSKAFHTRLMGSKSVYLYCSETTENLLLCDPSYSHLKSHIHSIPLEQQTMIPLFDENTDEESSICVTLLPAGHCVGSVMFLFEGQHGNVLYTGDFRLSVGDVKRIPFLHANGSIKDIKSIYIDTTFCLPKMNSLPTREQSRDAIIELIERWFSRGPQYVVSLLCKGMYGFEYLLKEVAMHFKTKVHISPERLRMYRYLPDMLPYFTTDGRATKIHACKWQANRHADSDLPCGQSIFPARKMKVLRIKPATMWVALSTEGMPADFKRYDKEQRVWRVVHSMHASMEEVQDLVGYLKPYHAYPNVPPAGLDSLEDAFERLRGLTRLHECNSCNKDESDELHFKEITPEHCVEMQKLQPKTLKPLPGLRRTVTDEKVLAQCKELGIEEEQCMAPVPKRRRGKILEERKVDSSRQLTEELTLDFEKDLISTSVSQTQDVSSLSSRYAPLLPEDSGDADKWTERVGREVQMEEKPSKQNFQLEWKHEDIGTKRNQGGKTESCNGFLVEGGGVNAFENSGHSKTKRDELKFPELEQPKFLSPGTPTKSQSQGEVAGSNFDVPPSPGNVKPRPGRLRFLHQRIQSGDKISMTKVNDGGAH